MPLPSPAGLVRVSHLAQPHVSRGRPPKSSYPGTGPVAWAGCPCAHQGPTLRRAPRLVESPATAVLKFLAIVERGTAHIFILHWPCKLCSWSRPKVLRTCHPHLPSQHQHLCSQKRLGHRLFIHLFIRPLTHSLKHPQMLGTGLTAADVALRESLAYRTPRP